MKLSPSEIVAAVERAEENCIDTSTGELAAERADALARYRGQPYGNEIEGRSQVVDRSVADTVEWIMPSLVRVYTGGDEIGKFEARGPEDEEAAQVETDVCNWYLTSRNDWFSQLSATLRDALLLKNGYWVVYWNKRYDTMTETYTGLAEEEAAMLMQDAEVEVVEHTERQDPVLGTVHDIKLERKKCDEYPAVESVPPDEIMVSARHRWTSVLDADFVQWRRRVSIGQLRAEGFDIPDETPEDDGWSPEWVNRDRYGMSSKGGDDDTYDPSRRMVTMRHCWMRIDLRGTGTPQLWRIDVLAGAPEPTRLEEADIIPIAACTPVVYSHSHVGTSVYDLIADLAIIKTTLLRQYLDGVYLQNSGRTAVDVGRVNLDDLLVTRPGGVVRVEGPPGDSMMPIVAADVGPSVLAGLQYVDATKEQRTGVRAWTEGLQANSLHPTATGVASVDSAAAQRIELIARTLASGFRDLFLILHSFACKYSTKAVQVKLDNKWTVIDPRSWVKRTDFQITVGLGVGTPDAQLAKLHSLAPLLAQAGQMGLAGPQEMYEYGAEILKAAGYRNPDRFLKPPQIDPQTGQPKLPPPPPNPLVEAEQVKQQGALQQVQAKGQVEVMTKQAELQAQERLELEKVRLQLEADMAMDERKRREAIEVARIDAMAQIEVAKINNGMDDDMKKSQEQLAATVENVSAATAAMTQLAQTMQAMMQQSAQMLQQHAAAMAAHAEAANMPKRIVRNPMTGRAEGVVPDNGMMQ